jgi:hypothetical protein
MKEDRNMTDVQRLLQHFDVLSQEEQKDAASAILKEIAKSSWSALTTDDFTRNAEELFLALDDEEAKNEKREPRR